MEPEPGGDARVGHAETALAQLLVAWLLGERDATAHQQAQTLAGIIREDGETITFAAVQGAIIAAWSDPERVDEEVATAVVAAARALLDPAGTAHRITLGAAGLIMLVGASMSRRPVEDLLLAAHAARTVEQHAVTRVAASRVLAAEGLTDAEQCDALTLLYVVDQDADAAGRAVALARGLDGGHPVRRRAEALWPDLTVARRPRELAALSAAVTAESRADAAARMAEVIASLRTPHTDDALLRGLQTATEGLAAEPVDVSGVRAGMGEVLGHWRARRRTGELPPAARAGIENILMLLKLDLRAPAPQLLFEIVEALADAGLGDMHGQSFAGEQGSAAGALLSAAMSEAAARTVKWPDFADIVARLGETHAILTSSQHARAGENLQVTALHLQPPASPSIRQHRLDDRAARTLSRLASQQLSQIDLIDVAALRVLVAALTPQPLRTALRDERPPATVVVPDGVLWAVPWHALHDLEPVVVAPSLGLHARLTTRAGPIGRVLAFVDRAIPGSGHVLAGLDAASHAGLTVVHGAARDDLRGAPEHDLLVIFGHGRGHGLDYEITLPGGPVSALQIADAAPPGRVLVASCWSGRLPPVAFPLSLPTALLLAGAHTVAAGLWPLPAAPTGQIVGRAVRSMASGVSLAPAVHRARADVHGRRVVDTHGLALFGIRDDRPADGFVARAPLRRVRSGHGSSGTPRRRRPVGDARTTRTVLDVTTLASTANTETVTRDLAGVAREPARRTAATSRWSVGQSFRARPREPLAAPPRGPKQDRPPAAGVGAGDRDRQPPGRSSLTRVGKPARDVRLHNRQPRPDVRHARRASN